MSRVGGIRILDRANLGKVLNEVALQQTGLFEGDASKVGKLVKADILVVGSISGNERNITVTMKAIDVATGNVLDGKIIRGSGDKIIEMAASASSSMAAILTGKNIGSISVSTNPDGCEIYIDGNSAGKSPIVEYKVPAGSHTVTAVKEGFIDAETNINVLPNGREKWTPSLASKKNLNRLEIGFAVYWYSTFSSKIGNGVIYSPNIGQTFEHFYLGFNLGYSKVSHNQQVSTVFKPDPVTVDRKYDIYNASVHFRYIPFLEWRYFSPYAGIFLEGGTIGSTKKEKGEWEKESVGEKQNYYCVGATFGINMFPYAKLSIFGEGRVHYYPKDIKRGEYYMPGGFLGSMQIKESTANLSGMSFGAGAKYYFD